MAATTAGKHFSMIRSFHLADLFTMANGVCGVTAIFQAMKFLSTQDSRHLYLGALLVPLALIFDVLDGRIARWRHAVFSMCGLSRLARYNVTAESLSNEKGKVEYFEGTPIPTSVVPLGLLMLAFYTGNLYLVEVPGLAFHGIALLFLLSGALMISKTLRIPKP